MSVAIVFLLALIVAGFIAYPLLTGQPVTRTAPAVTDADIERAVRKLRRTQAQSSERCPSCGRGYEPGDRFCVGCGQLLDQASPSDLSCPSCGAALRAGDRFCAKCGATLSTREAQDAD